MIFLKPRFLVEEEVLILIKGFTWAFGPQTAMSEWKTKTLKKLLTALLLN